jgi:hypothetical protein
MDATFLMRFAERVQPLARVPLNYNPTTRKNELPGGGEPFFDGTLLTETAEARDHSEGHIALESSLLTATREARDATEGDTDLYTIFADLGTTKTGTGEQSDPTRVV